MVPDPDGRPDPDRSLILDTTRAWREAAKERRLLINPRLLAERCSGTTDCDGLVEDMLTRLRSLETSEGQPLFDKVALEAGGGEAVAAPFIRLRIHESLISRADRKEGSVSGKLYRDGPTLHPLADLVSFQLGHTGTHTMDGILCLAGPGVLRGALSQGASVYDVAPTILRLLGLARSREMEGRVLSEVLDDQRLAPSRPDLPTYESNSPIPRLTVERSDDLEEQEERFRERLRTLGYIQ